MISSSSRSRSIIILAAADPGGGEGAVPRAQEQARHPQVRPHIPRLAHRPGVCVCVCVSVSG